MSIYRSEGNVARRIKKQYRGVDGVARRIVKEYRGDYGVARRTMGKYWFVFDHGGSIVSDAYTGLQDGNARLYKNDTSIDHSAGATGYSWADFRIYGDESFAGKTIEITYTRIFDTTTYTQIHCFYAGDIPGAACYQYQLNGNSNQQMTVAMTVPSNRTANFFLVSMTGSSAGRKEILISSLKINGEEII